MWRWPCVDTGLPKGHDLGSKEVCCLWEKPEIIQPGDNALGCGSEVFGVTGGKWGQESRVEGSQE